MPASVIRAFAEFERALIWGRQKEGIELAQAKGLYEGRKPYLMNNKLSYPKNK
jgi:DNA invertase Pin-like site-specific DNA recombinase